MILTREREMVESKPVRCLSRKRVEYIWRGKAGIVHTIAFFPYRLLFLLLNPEIIDTEKDGF